MRDYEVKSNSIVVDFTKDTGVVIPKKMIYTSGDINTSYIRITCNNNDEPIDFFRYEVNINIVRKDGSYLNAECTVVDAARGEIEVMLTTSMLYVGLNHLEVMLSMGDKQLVSPMIPYKVVTSISSDMDENIPNTNEYPILIQLIGEVKALPEKLDRELTPIVKGKIDLMNKTIQDGNQYLEYANSNEAERQSNEEVRKTQELSRQESINSMTSSFNNKVGEINAKILETTNITNENTKKIDNKIVDIQSQLDTRVTTKFTEVDETVSTKLTQLQNQVDAKILDVDASKDSMISTVNSKIAEVDSAKTDMVSQVGNKIVDADGKIVDCENRMQVIENTFGDLVGGTGYATTQYVDTKVSGIVNSAPEALDTLKELSDALGNDPNFATTMATQIGEKANKADVYNKQYIDNRLATKEEIRLVDVKVDTNKADILTVKNELDKSVNTKYSTVNGTKEFDCKDGYIDNIYMEGKTQILDANNNPCEHGVAGAKLVSIGQGDKIEVLSIQPNGNVFDGKWNGGGIDTVTGLDLPSLTQYINTDFIYFKYESNKWINAKIFDVNVVKQVVALFYDKDKKFLSFGNLENTNNFRIAPVQNCSYVRFRVEYNINKIPKMHVLGYDYHTQHDTVGNLDYIQPKYDKKQISTTLRSLPNGVKDELVKMGNSYYKLEKCEEVFLDSNCDVYNSSATGQNTVIAFRIGLELNAKNYGEIISSYFKGKDSNSWKLDEEGIITTAYQNKYYIYIKILRSKLTTQDINGFAQWLQDNPFSVVYELAESKQIPLPNFNPQTFGDKTTFLLNSGVIQGECNFEVTNSLGSEIEVLKGKVGSLEENLNDKTIYFDISFLNGWGYWGNQSFVRNIYDINNVNIFGLLAPGVLTKNAPIFILPKEVRPSKKLTSIIRSNTGKMSLIFIDPSGLVELDDMDIQTDAWYAMNISYMKEV